MVQLLSISQVAQRLSISRRAAFTLVKTPGFPSAVRLSSRMVRYREADLEAWLASRVSQG
jgi:predicted DNA-binding transcriptional regulator AlpA